MSEKTLAHAITRRGIRFPRARSVGNATRSYHADGPPCTILGEGRARKGLGVIVAFVVAANLLTGAAVADDTPEALARRILDEAGVAGGVIVHVPCGDGMLTAALRAGGSYLVQGLDTDPQRIEAARAKIRSLGAYGPVSVAPFDGKHLPYAENLVNLLVVHRPVSVDRRELLRVLRPGGVVVTVDPPSRSLDSWRKPWPENIDQWTHHWHDAGGNPVGRDRVVGPPAHLQWTAAPRWARSHGWTPSTSAMVSAGGRLFYISDETLTGADGSVPSQWFVVARDAFNGVLLWKRPIPKWGSAQFSGTPDTGAGVTVGRFTMPLSVVKRLVAVGDTVFVTLGPDAPVTALDAATGEVGRVYAETERADEILCTGGRLIVSLNPSGRPAPGAAPAKHICAVDVQTGRVLWKQGPLVGIRASVGQDPFGRLELAAGDGKVFALTAETIIGLSADSGQTLWQIDRPALPADAVRRVGFAGMYEYLLSVLVYHNGVVLLAQPEPNIHHTYHTMPGSLYAFDAESGQRMWKHAYGGWGHCTQPDVFVIGDVVWTHVNAETEFGFVWGHGYKAKDPSVVDYRVQALDLRTGRVLKELSTKQIFNVGHHHRCCRNKSTERYLLSCRRGVEFVDLATGENFQDHWVRSGCQVGYLPCNGLLYVTPHPCQCYIHAKLTGFNALAPRSGELEKPNAQEVASCKLDQVAHRTAASSNKCDRIHPGPAYGNVDFRPAASPPDGLDDWPTYRHDLLRSGATEAQVPTELKMVWRADLGTRPSAVVVSGGKVLVAGVDTHTVHALDADTGDEVWQYTAGGRVDSPPTVYQGTAIFGSADGCVRCVRAADGRRVWRFDAAPARRLVIACDQLESAWPVPGSVLVHQGRCWFAAGRSSYLDGGIAVYALDPETGDVIECKTVYSPDPVTGKMRPATSARTIPGLLNDIPVSDGANVFIRQMACSSTNGRAGPHLYATAGYLDSSWFNRTFWQIGQARTSGLMVLGKDVAYGMELYSSRGADAVFRPGSRAYRLMCIPITAPSDPGGKPPKAPRRRRGPKPRWVQHLGIRVTAMVRAANTIFVAGSPDVVDPQDPHGAWEGRKGGVLAAFAAGDGLPLVEYRLPAPPVWDGMAAAGGRLFISTLDGAVVCMAPPQPSCSSHRFPSAGTHVMASP